MGTSRRHRWVHPATSILCLFAVGLTVPVLADTYVKSTQHTDSRYQNGLMQPAEDLVIETWIAPRRKVSITPNWRLVADQETGRFTMISLADKTYLQLPLPLDLAKVVPADEVEPIGLYKYSGTVTPAGETRQLAGKSCRRFDIQRWVLFGGVKHNEQEMVAWYTTDVPVDPQTFPQMQQALYALSNFGPELMEAYLKIPGFLMMYESVRYTEGTAIKTTYRVEEVATREAPAGIYDIPEGFTKKESYSIEELRRR
jgi:hypothetical protein